MSIEKFAPSYDILKERVEKLKGVLPEAFEDGKFNFTTLKESLGEFVEGESEETEHYAFTWPGKKQARQLASKPPQGMLFPAKGEGINEDKTNNILIEGDNLEVLKLLQKTYANRIKLIYIDPPYNTGKDFIYNDNFTQPLDEYLKLTGQINEEGEPLVANTKADGRFHTKWLNMMYPRLKMARNLLRDDGAILVSIGDEEAAGMKLLLNEIFGEENYSATFSIIRSEGGGLAKQVVKGHDYLYVYAKNIQAFSPLRRPRDVRGEIVEVSGTTYWIEEDWLRREFGKYGTCLYSEIEKYHGIEKKKEIDKGIAKGEYRLITKRDGAIIVGRLRKLDDDSSKFHSVQKHLNAKAAHDLEEIKMEPVFDFPKPVSLIREIVLGGSFFSKNKQDIILDFFAGSGTTGHGVMEQNAEDGGNRQYILVQLPEPFNPDNKDHESAIKLCDKLKRPQNIAELTKERLRRTIQSIHKADPKYAGDLGFRVYTLQKSNFTKWRDYTGSDINELVSLFTKQETTLISDWEKESLFAEIILHEGFPLTSIRESVSTIKENVVWKVSSNFCEHSLFVCLDKHIKHKTIEALALTGKDIFICLDNAVSDEDKVRLSDKGLIKTI